MTENDDQVDHYDSYGEHQQKVNKALTIEALEKELTDLRASEQRAYHLLGLYAQEQAGTDTMLEAILEDLQSFQNGTAGDDLISEIIEELERWSGGRQARDTWG